MKKSKRRKAGTFLAGALVLLMVVSVAAPSLQAGMCERALAKCGIDATVAGVTGGPGAAALWGVGCLAGYHWCLRYLY